MVTAFIGVGSNLGNRSENIKNAIDCLRKTKDVVVEKVSSIIETDPAGGVPQPRYLNGAIKLKVALSPLELLVVCQDIENKLGRQRLIESGPRTIDLDILLYGNEFMDEPGLKIPHPRMCEREFVLKPLFEIEPDMKKITDSIKPIPKKDSLESRMKE